MKDYYRVLGVPRTSSRETIQTAHVQLKEKLRADGKALDLRRDTELDDAYEVLSDPEKRAAYDAEYVRLEKLTRLVADESVPLHAAGRGPGPLPYRKLIAGYLVLLLAGLLAVSWAGIWLVRNARGRVPSQLQTLPEPAGPQEKPAVPEPSALPAGDETRETSEAAGSLRDGELPSAVDKAVREIATVGEEVGAAEKGNVRETLDSESAVSVGALELLSEIEKQLSEEGPAAEPTEAEKAPPVTETPESKEKSESEVGEVPRVEEQFVHSPAERRMLLAKARKLAEEAKLLEGIARFQMNYTSRFSPGGTIEQKVHAMGEKNMDRAREMTLDAQTLVVEAGRRW